MLQAGIKIYYTGDMANCGGFGAITGVETNRWGTYYNIHMDDGETIRGISPAYFDKQPGQRFWTAEDWQKASQSAKDSAMQARFAQMGL